MHEPFSYLSDQGYFDVGGSRCTSAGELLAALLSASSSRRVFFKDTTDYRYDTLLADRRLYRDLINTFMIREPSAAVASHLRIDPAATVDAIGFEHLHAIFCRVRQETGETPLVIDGDDLVANPEAMVRAYCERVGLAYVPDALRWETGTQAAWRRTSRWHEDVERSTGLGVTPRRAPLPPDRRERDLVRHHQPFYDALYAHRLVAG
ncbi:hypothetical protein Aph01nite_70810 [Acrocarpospora phusangensis]|uniref:Sulfotransferase family protein n=1 Tax=Acrocarpospora phusangensis TaxID=1070424 RepID=A0A919UNQ9_9ACTN|nr:hypothetical protein Aph01nite_70810 [Acrocarpospora phusangensis]